MKKTLTLLLSSVLIISALCAAPAITEAAAVGRVTNVQMAGRSSSTVKLKWKKVKGATGYQVYYSTAKSKGYKKGTAVGNQNTAVVRKLAANRTYYFKVRALRKKAKGKFSAAVSVKTLKWGTITGVKMREYGVIDGYSWDKENAFGGCACYVVDFSKVSGATGYQVCYYWSGTTKTKKNIKVNRFHFNTQDISPTMKVRAYKKKNGKTTWGPWKNINLNKAHRTGKNYYYDEYEKSILSKYPLV